MKEEGKNGLSMATATNGFLLNQDKLERILPNLTYLRFNISAGKPKRYAEIMGCKEHWFERVCKNIELAVKIKKEKIRRHYWNANGFHAPVP